MIKGCAAPASLLLDTVLRPAPYSTRFSISVSWSLIKIVKLSVSDYIRFSVLLTTFPQSKGEIISNRNTLLIRGCSVLSNAFIQRTTCFSSFNLLLQQITSMDFPVLCHPYTPRRSPTSRSSIVLYTYSWSWLRVWDFHICIHEWGKLVISFFITSLFEFIRVNADLSEWVRG